MPQYYDPSGSGQWGLGNPITIDPNDPRIGTGGEPIYFDFGDGRGPVPVTPMNMTLNPPASTTSTATTPATTSGTTSLGHPVDFDPTTYGKLNPDLQTYYDTNKAELDAYYGSKEGFLSNHYLMAGATEGRTYKEGQGGGGGGETGGNSGWAGTPISSDVYNLAKEQISYTSRRLGEIEEARKLGDMTGTLTSAELRMFDEMESSAVANLKSQVNDQTQDVWNTALADLVNRGVLQGTVGTKILGTIGGENVRTIAEGINTLRIAKNTGELTAMEGNKNRAITWQNMLTQESLGLLGLGQGYANIETTAQTSAENRALQEAIAQLQATTQTNIAGMTNKNQWDIANLDAKTRLATAGLYAGAAGTASGYGLAGNLGVAGIGALMKWYDATYGNKNPTPTGLYTYNTATNAYDFYNDPAYNYPGDY